MSRTLVLPALLALLAPTGHAQEDAARLIPAKASVLVRLDSLDALLDLVHAFAPIAGEPVSSLDATGLLGGMQFPLDPAVVDGARPLFLALSIDPAAPQPGLTWVVPVRTGATPGASSSGTPVVTAGGYAGTSNLAGYAAAASPSPLAAKLQRGLVSVHVDLAALLAVYGPLVDMGLKQAEANIDTQSDASPLDMTPLLEGYFSGLRAFLASAESLDLGVERRGDELAFVGGFTARAGSALDGWEAPQRADLAALAGHLEPDGAALMVAAFDWTSLLARFGGFIDAAVQIYPEPLRSDLQLVIAGQKKVMALLEPGIALRANFGQDGVEAAYLLRSKHPAELVTAVEEALSPFVREQGFVRLSAPTRSTVDGLAVRSWDVVIDWQAALSTLPDVDATDEVDLERMQGMLETVYGQNLRIALVTSGETALFAIGQDDAAIQAAAQRLHSPAALAPAVARLIERSGGGTPSFAYRLDFGPAMRQMMTAMEPLMPEPIPWPDVPFGVDVWGSIRGPTWSGGTGVDLAELLRFVQAVQALETK